MTAKTRKSVPDLKSLEDRAGKLAKDKSYLELAIRLMIRISETPGLENTIDSLLHNILDVIGGSNIILYYRIDDDIFYSDVYGKKMMLTAVEDPSVKKVFKTRTPAEFEGDFGDTGLMTPEFTRAYTWIFPLLVGPDIIGVIRMENLEIGMKEMSGHLPAFFSHAALILKNEILGHTRLKKACDQLNEANEALKKAKALLEKKVEERTKELKTANVRLNAELSKRIETEQVLKEHDTLLQGILESGDSLIFSVDKQYRYTSFNRGHARVMKTIYNADISIGSGFLDYLTNPEDRAEAKQNIDLALAGRQIVEEAYSGEKQRSRLFFRVSYSPIRSETGMITGVAIVARDITDRKRDEENLKKMSARLNEAQQIAHVGNWELDIETNVLTWSDEIYRIFEIDPARFGASYEAFLNAIHPDDREAVNLAFTGSLNTKMLYSIEHRLLFPDGRIKHVHEEGKTVYRDDKPVRSVGTVQDITEFRRTQDKLLESESRFRSFVERANDIIYTLSDTGIFTYVSPNWKDLLGHEISEVEGQPFSRFVHPDDLETCMTFFRKAVESGEKLSGIEYRARHKNGTWRWHTSNTSVIHDKEGRIVSYLGIARDVTERKKAEAALSESEESFRLLVEQSPVSVQVLSPDGMTLQVNAAFETLWGITFSDLNDYNILSDKQLDERGILSYIRQAFAGERTFIPPVEYNAVEAVGLGRKRWVQANIYPVRDKAGNIRNVILIHEDITEHMLAEQKLQRINRELRAISSCNQALLHATDEVALLGEICRIVCDEAGYRLAWVGFAENDEEKTIHPIAWAGYEAGYLKDTRRSWAENEIAGRGPSGMAVRRGETVVIQDFETDASMDFWREQAWKRGYRSGVALPLKNEVDTVFGVLMIYSSGTNVITPGETRLLEELAGDLAFGIITLRTRKELKESRERLNAVFENASDGILIADKETGKFLFCNPMACRMLGYSESEVLSLSVDRIHPEKELPFVWDQFQKQARKEITLAINIPVQREDGTIFYADINSFTIFLDGRECLAGFFRDITELKLKEEKVKQLASIVESSEDAIISKTLDGLVISWNRGAEKMYGYTENEMIGKPISLLAPEGRHDEVPAILEKVGMGEHIEHYETIRRRKDGSMMDVSLAVSPIFDSDGHIIAASTIARNITQSKRAEEEIIKLNQELEQRVEKRTEQLRTSNQELEAFSYSVSHDLRAPLRAISGFSRILYDTCYEKLDDESKELIQDILRNTGKMGQLIDDLLEFSRLNRKEIRMDRIDMELLFRQTFEEMKEQNPSRNIEFVLKPLPAGYGDYSLVKQVVINILSNAVKFTGNKELALITIEGNDNAEETTFMVSDNGVGFDMKYVDKIFGVFQRLHSAAEFEGTGVGLAIVQRIINRHGGKVWATAEKDAGATLFFTLPKSNSATQAI